MLNILYYYYIIIIIIIINDDDDYYYLLILIVIIINYQLLSILDSALADHCARLQIIFTYLINCSLVII